MELTGSVQPLEMWHPIVPEEGIPEGVEAWTVEIPNVGILHVGIVDKPGEAATIDDQKAYALGSELDGLEISSLTLLSKGYKTLNLVLNPSDSRRAVFASLRASESKSIFAGVFQTNDEERGLLSPLSYWMKEPEKEGEKSEARDVMVMPGEDLKKIQIHFEGGDN